MLPLLDPLPASGAASDAATKNDVNTASEAIESLEWLEVTVGKHCAYHLKLLLAYLYKRLE